MLHTKNSIVATVGSHECCHCTDNLIGTKAAIVLHLLLMVKGFLVIFSTLFCCKSERVLASVDTRLSVDN